MPSKESRYFIALIPPDPIRSELEHWKQFFKEEYQSKASLNSPPHITLHMPLVCPDKKLALLIHQLQGLASGYTPFAVNLKDFGAFPPRVIYVDVMPQALLFAFQKEVVRLVRQVLHLPPTDYRNTGFHPHLTLAFRDLKKEAFQRAWEKFSLMNFEAEFMIDRVYLLRHNGKIWEIFQEIPIGKAKAS
jgi:2'-5' RNA ligase